MKHKFKRNTYPLQPKHGFCAFDWDCSFPKCGCKEIQQKQNKMKNERTEIVGFRVKRSDVIPINEHVKEFLKFKGYKFYKKRKRKPKYKPNGKN